MFAKLAVRDLSIVAVALLVWWLAADLSAGSGALADFTGFAAGLLLGLTGFVLHEWGHLAGAVATRSAVRPGASLGTPFVFSFHPRRNTLGQFLVMSFSGFAMTAAVLFAFYAYLPDGLLASRVARGAALFSAFLTVVLELPIVAVALYRRAIPGAVALRVGDRPPAAAGAGH